MECFKDEIDSIGTNTKLRIATEKSTADLEDNSSTVEKNESVRKETSRNRSYATEQYKIVPTASFQFDFSKIKLCPDVLEALKDIEKTCKMGLNNKAVETKCCNFLSRYGSHVSTGRFVVGGIFARRCRLSDNTTASFKDQKITKRSDNTGSFEILTNSTGVHVDAFSKSFSVKDCGKTSRDEFSETEISFWSIGGPSNVETSHTWTEELLNNPNTWSIISRGERCGIWEIITHHKQDLHNHDDVSIVLQRAWKNNFNHGEACAMSTAVIDHTMAVLNAHNNSETLEGILDLVKCISNDSNAKENIEGHVEIEMSLTKAIKSEKDFDLHTKASIKLLLRSTGLQNSNTSIIDWYRKRLFDIPSNSCENIMLYIKSSVKNVYVRTLKLSSEKHWQDLVTSLITEELAEFLLVQIKTITDPIECLRIIIAASMLNFSFKTRSQRVVQYHQYPSMEKYFEDVDRKPFLLFRETIVSAMELSYLVEKELFPALRTLHELSLDSEGNLIKVLNENFLKICSKTLQLDSASLEPPIKDDRNLMLHKSEYLVIALQCATLGFDAEKHGFTKQMSWSEQDLVHFQHGTMLWQMTDQLVANVPIVRVVQMLDHIFTETLTKLQEKQLEYKDIGYEYMNKLFKYYVKSLDSNMFKGPENNTCMEFISLRTRALLCTGGSNTKTIKTMDDVLKLIESMIKLVNVANQSVSLFKTIPDNVFRFGFFLETEFVTLWENVLNRTRLATPNSEEKTGRPWTTLETKINEYFRALLYEICQNHIDTQCLNVNRTDVWHELASSSHDMTAYKLKWKVCIHVLEHVVSKYIKCTAAVGVGAGFIFLLRKFVMKG